MNPRITTRVSRIATQARKAALRELIAESKRVLPEGWTVYMMVGWGLSLDNDQGQKMVDTGPYGDDGMPRLPKGVRPLMLAMAEFHDIFGPGNEVFTHKGLRPPRKREA